MTAKEIQLLVDISEKLGTLSEGITTLTNTTATLVSKVDNLEKKVVDHDRLLENFAERQDVKNLGDMYRLIEPMVKDHESRLVTLEDAPANAALAASKRLKGLVWTVAGSVGGVGTIAGIVYVWQALDAASKLVVKP